MLSSFCSKSHYGYFLVNCNNEIACIAEKELHAQVPNHQLQISCADSLSLASKEEIFGKKLSLA